MQTPSPVVFARYRPSAPPSWLWFDDLVEVVQTSRPEEVLPQLDAVEQAVERGLGAAGFLSYEAASGLDDAFCTRPPSGVPLLWFGLFRRATESKATLCEQPAPFHVNFWRPSITPEQYGEAIVRIKDYIARGHTYQVNHTFRLRSTFTGDPWSLFIRLCEAQRGQHGAYLDTGRHVICSASPELFFHLDGQTLSTRPMKGTSSRGLTVADDRRLRNELANSVKNRAENAMIVDMMRNDLGRIARRGSVRVDSAFDVEKYPTVFQMTSRVSAETSASLPGIMNAIFPPASITGAPKIRTMQIIRELEPDARGVYTGAIGYWLPGRQAQFSVAIRTVTIDRDAGIAEYGTGGGIVWDSDTAEEYSECQTKAAVLTVEAPQFELLETILYEPEEGYFLLDKHLERLADSAEYFDFSLDPPEIRQRLADLAVGFGDRAHRVRLRVGREGQISIDVTPSPPAATAPWRLRLASRPVDSGNVFLYHKTTGRAVHEAAFASRGDCDDVVLYNERGEATETTIANLVIEKEGRLVTPPVACGLLAGVFRRHLLETGQLVEAMVGLDDLRNAERLFAVNSVRKWVRAVMADATAEPTR
jgi:para-aminobenzoate synthetase / 4-amino-4-deoxychorismate lyase